jgi:hypothetical protein
MDPAGAGKYDGISLDPLETIFVPTHARLAQLERRSGHALKAHKYLSWYNADKSNTTWLAMNEQRGPSSGNSILPQMLMTHVQGVHCFDHLKYLARNPDLKVRHSWLMPIRHGLGDDHEMEIAMRRL